MSDFPVSPWDMLLEMLNGPIPVFYFEDPPHCFLSYLEPGSHILDFGCGSGYDTQFFLGQNYSVTAIDPSIKSCQKTSKRTGLQVKHMSFQELEDVAQYHGIWAWDSILHLPYPELKSVLFKMARALKKDGIIYASFKYGTFEGKRKGKYFTDMTEERMEALINEMDCLKIEEQWVDGFEEENQWLNVILRLVS